MNFSKNWYAVYTRRDCEKKVAQLLSKRGFEHYCPLNHLHQKAGSRKKTVHEALLSFVFVRVSENDHVQLIQLPGVINMVHWLQQPAIFPEAEIDIMREFLHKHTNVQFKKISVVMTELVRMIGDTATNTDTLQPALIVNNSKIQLPSIGYILSVRNETIVEEKKTEQLNQEPASTSFIVQ